jgi:hypothetical protein
MLVVPSAPVSVFVQQTHDTRSVEQTTLHSRRQVQVLQYRQAQLPSADVEAKGARWVLCLGCASLRCEGPRVVLSFTLHSFGETMWSAWATYRTSSNHLYHDSANHCSVPRTISRGATGRKNDNVAADTQQLHLRW